MIGALTIDLAKLPPFLSELSIQYSKTQILFFLLGIIALYLFFRFIFHPMLEMWFYRRQGLSTDFIPVIGSFLVHGYTSFKKHNDALYDLKLLSQTESGSKAIVWNLGSTPVVILLDPELKKSFALQHNSYELADYFGDFGRLFTEGLPGVKGNEWKKQRRIISQCFHFDFIKENVPVIQRTTIELLNGLGKKDLSDVKMLREMEKIAGENIGRIFFSENLQKYTIKGEPVTVHLMNTLEKMSKLCLSPGYMIFGPKFVQKGIFKQHRVLLDDLRQLENMCRRLLVERKNGGKGPKDLAWYLVDSQSNLAEESRLSDESIIANYGSFIAAGTSTTAQLVTMTLYELSRNPKMLQRLQQEIHDIYDKHNPISADSLNQMDWATALLNETLRMYNPAGLGAGLRHASTTHKIGDLMIRKGTIVIASFMNSCFDPEYFENPWAYNPQRWIDNPNVSEPYAYTPFWAGPRNCIGKNLALIEAKIMLVEFVKRFEFKLKEGFVLKMGVTKAYGPEKDVPMELTQRI